MNARYLLTICLILALPDTAIGADEDLAAVIAGDHRTPSFVKRDAARHPQEVLEFFGIRPDMAVGEIWPSTGWWSEILAPYLRDRGRYYAVGFSLTANRTPQWRRDMARELIAKFEASPELYDRVILTSLSIPEDAEIAPPGSLDLVLTFRNVHNWLNGDYAPAVFEAMYAALKPGGVLGLVEHRLHEDADWEAMKRSGYVKESMVIEMAEAAGFRLMERSELNANPKDTKDHPAGVWTLPPSLRHCRRMDDNDARDACMERYRAIGESDRMTLKFMKPVASSQ